MTRLALLLATLTLLAGASTASAVSWWQPSGTLSWQMQFSGRIDKSVKADAYDIDAFDSSAALVAKLHDLGRHVMRKHLELDAWRKTC